MTTEDAQMVPAPLGPVERGVGRPAPERAVAVVTECEACFTPDVCQLRGTCDHYRAELTHAALVALLPGTYYMDPPDGGSVTLLEQLRRMANDAERYRQSLVTITPQTMRQAVAQCERELPRFCDNCMTEDACNVRGMCAHTLREQEAHGAKVAASAPAMAAALDCIVRRLQMDVDDGSRPDQWTMEDLIRTAKAALPAGWVIGAP